MEFNPKTANGFVSWTLLGIMAAIIALLIAYLIPGVIPPQAAKTRL
jgi:hypothetical protein